MTLTPHELYYGSDDPPPEQISLRAGALSLIYEAGTIRYVKLGEIEVLHQVYAAVRDRNWGTVPGALKAVQIDAQADSFHIAFISAHQQGEIDFVWQGVIDGTADHRISFSFAGEARSTFARNRIGFCVLHPASLAGLPCEVLHVNGERHQGAFPQVIAPHQPFFNLRAITHEVIPGVRAEVLMQGDAFEMEDQRNWIDASYKTYCTPLGLPFPVTIPAGTEVSQKITLRLEGSVPTVSAQAALLLLAAGDEYAEAPSNRLPAIGIQLAASEPLTALEIERLRALNLGHLRCALHLDADNQSALDQLASAADAARQIGAPLEIALFVPDDAPDAWEHLRAALDRVLPPLARWLVFSAGKIATSEAAILAARSHLSAYGAPIGAGTDAFFAELNRNRPPFDMLDFVAYSNNPQVHAFDTASLAETAAMHGVTVESARQFSGKPVVVSPITFRMRWNPNATAPDAPTPPGELPTQVDVRQMSLFGAGWTLASLRSLAAAGALGATFYEAVGWLGIMERETGSPLPDKFKSIPGGVYPMYHIFADVGEFRAAHMIPMQSSDALRVAGMLLRRGDGAARLLLANLTPQTQTVTITGIGGVFRLKLMDETNAEFAMREPELYRAGAGERVEAGASGLALTLKPYACARLDRETA